MANGFFVAFNGPPLRTLAAKATGPKQPPDVTGMITNSRQILDQSGHSGQSPQVGFISVGGRARQQPRDDFFHLGGGQFGFWTRRTFAGQGRVSAFLPKVSPFVSHLPGDPETAGYFRRRAIFLKKP